ncbi:hypothetical protein KIN20_000512 [Parelaphostrongylus tenuis]|uniref:Uncharacterized protein n=1 Tax=Parelaphostrongylus tenuis TaxID=148309 RepID=A0AAD5QBK0_PARTN|nr:hypothetical protein KIN20_000512 [Parelaphostrongylus tenuis]
MMKIHENLTSALSVNTGYRSSIRRLNKSRNSILLQGGRFWRTLNTRNAVLLLLQITCWSRCGSRTEERSKYLWDAAFSGPISQYETD